MHSCGTKCERAPRAPAHFELPGLHAILGLTSYTASTILVVFLPLQILLSLGDKRLIVHLRPDGSYVLLPWATQILVPEETPMIVTCGFGASGLE